MATSRAKQKTYSYDDLSSLQPRTQVNIFGVVKYVKPPFRTKGTDYCMTLSLVDPSLSRDKKLRCLFFHKNEAQLPMADVGDIIRLHRLNVSLFKGELQGQNSVSLSWVLFDGRVGGSLDSIKASSTNYIITETDKQKLESLRGWAADQTDLQLQVTCISDVTPGSYFNTVCQVVARQVLEEHVCLSLQVWDGTHPSSNIRMVPDKAETIAIKLVDPLLMRGAKRFVYQVLIYDDHFIPASKIKPGDFLRLCNLHAVSCKIDQETTSSSEHNDQQAMEIKLHRGTSFGRRCEILPEDSVHLKSLLERLACIPLDPLSQDHTYCASGASSSQGQQEVLLEDSPDSDSQVLPTGTEETRLSNCAQQINKGDSSSGSLQCGQPIRAGQTLTNPGKQETNSSLGILSGTGATCFRSETQNSHEIVQGNFVAEEKENYERNEDGHTRQRATGYLDAGAAHTSRELETFSGSLPTCIITTCTVVLNRPDEDRSKIQQVLNYEAENKLNKTFLLRVKVMDYYPRADNPHDFIQLLCPSCKYLTGHPKPGNPNHLNTSPPDSQLQLGSSFKGVPHYICPRCETTKQTFQGLESPPHLQYIFMMRLLVRDSSNSLLISTWGKQAKTFFQGVEPEDFLAMKEKFRFIQDCLDSICPPGTEDGDKPWMECRVESYSSSKRTVYSMFDTVIV